MIDSKPKERPGVRDAEHVDRIDALMHQGINRHTFPGAVLLVGIAGEVVLHRAYGMADLFSARPMTSDTLFDLASLTKPLATVAACMALVQQGRLELDRPCAEIWPDFFKGALRQVTPCHLLSHTSGLPPWKPYFMRLQHIKTSERLTALQSWIRSESLNFSPGEKDDYSDLGFMLLQWLAEKISGQRLDQLVCQQIYRPLNVSSLFFVERDSDGPARNLFAATEMCPWRNRLLCGQVHDDNAYVMGGVAGHAGLFGTAMAVFELLQAMLMADRRESSNAFFDPVVIRTFFQRQGTHRYALGFDSPSDQDSSAGNYFPADSVGHLGFTGTSFWMHRHKRVVVILLTNRVHPSRFNSGIKAFRPRLHDTVMEALFS